MDGHRIDINTVLQTLYTLYSNTGTDHDSYSAASKWLTDLQNSVSPEYESNISFYYVYLSCSD